MPPAAAADGAGPALRKGLGQHHLVSGALAAPLVSFLAPADARVLEIGPGGGVLTGELLAAGARVAAVELDIAWAAELGRRRRGERLALAVADALALDLRRLAPGTLVAGNLPYAIATAFIERMLFEADGVPRAAFLVQLEVARRLAALPGERAYGSLSVIVQAFARVVLLGRVRPGSFRPPPRVEGAFVGLLRREPPLPGSEMPPFAAWVRGLFSTRRKTLRNTLGRLAGSAAAGAALAAAGIAPERRAEELSLAGLISLYRRCGGPPSR